MVLAAAGEPAWSQDTTIRETCGEPSRIEAARTLRLGGADDPGRIGTTANFARDSRGNLIVFRQNQGHVFDSTGMLLRTFGREGEGPGEYRLVRDLIVTPGDSVLILDSRNARITLLDPEYEVAATTTLPFTQVDGGLRVPSGEWVINANVLTQDRVGWPLHLLGPDGTVARSFGSLNPVFRRDAPSLGKRSLASAGGNRIWAAHEKEYRIELWTVGGDRLRALVRDVDWFRPWVLNGPTTPEKPWNPRLASMQVDSQGIMWVHVSFAKPNWSDYVYEFTPGAFAIREPMHQAFRVLLEAVDPNRGCVLARFETDENLLGPISDGSWLSYHENPDGVPFLDVWRITLNRASFAPRRWQ
jgi:hypothetical protein